MVNGMFGEIVAPKKGIFGEIINPEATNIGENPEALPKAQNLLQNVGTGASLGYYQPKGMEENKPAQYTGEALTYALVQGLTTLATAGLGDAPVSAVLAGLKGSRLGRGVGEVAGAVGDIIPEAPGWAKAVGEVFDPLMSGITKGVGVAGKGAVKAADVMTTKGLPFGIVGAAKPAENTGERVKRGLTEDLMASAIIKSPELVKPIKNAITWAASEGLGRIAGKEPGALKEVMREGYSKMIAPEIEAKDLIKNTIGNINTSLNKFEVAKGVTPANIESNTNLLKQGAEIGKQDAERVAKEQLASHGEQMSTNLENKLTENNNKVKQLFQGGLGLETVDSAPIQDAIQQQLTNYSKYPMTAIDKKAEIDQLMKLADTLNQFPNGKIPAFAAHDIKQTLYEMNTDAAYSSNFNDMSKKVINIQKVVADSLNKQLRDLSPEYSVLNDEESTLLDLKGKLKGLFGESGKTSESLLGNLESKDIGTQKMIKQADVGNVLPKIEETNATTKSNLANVDLEKEHKIAELTGSKDYQLSQNIRNIVKQQEEAPGTVKDLMIPDKGVTPTQSASSSGRINSIAKDLISESPDVQWKAIEDFKTLDRETQSNIIYQLKRLGVTNEFKGKSQLVRSIMDPFLRGGLKIGEGMSQNIGKPLGFALTGLRNQPGLALALQGHKKK